MYQFDAKYTMGRSANIKLGYGQASIDDKNPSSPDGKVKLNWYSIEPRVEINDKIYMAARYSRIATQNTTIGYQFNGEPFANGDSYGFSTTALSRSALATGYSLTPRAIVKFEYSYDTFTLIDGATGDHPKRWFVGTDLAVRF
jgi:hypothetical protein